MNYVYTKGTQTLVIEQQDQPDSPRTWDNLGTMVFLGGHNYLGDTHDIDSVEKANRIENSSISLPVYMYSHSGKTIATSPFSCPWDSGKIGFIYITQKTAMEKMGWKSITPKRKALLVKYLEGEVETLNQWLTGDVYGFTLTDSTTEDEHSCWGFYGDDFEAIFDHIGEKKIDWVEK